MQGQISRGPLHQCRIAHQACVAAPGGLLDCCRPEAPEAGRVEKSFLHAYPSIKIIASKLLLLFEGNNVFPFRRGNYKLSIITCSVLLQEADSRDDQDSRAEAPGAQGISSEVHKGLCRSAE
jgi:hypothetical protein